jgi:hypothetical protein
VLKCTPAYRSRENHMREFFALKLNSNSGWTQYHITFASSLPGVSFHRDYAVVSSWRGRVTIFDKNNVPVAFLGTIRRGISGQTMTPTQAISHPQCLAQLTDVTSIRMQTYRIRLESMWAPNQADAGRRVFVGVDYAFRTMCRWVIDRLFLYTCDVHRGRTG